MRIAAPGDVAVIIDLAGLISTTVVSPSQAPTERDFLK